MRGRNSPVVHQTTCGVIDVVSPFEESDVTIENCSIETSEITPDDTVEVSVTVSNDNSVAAGVELDLYIDGGRRGGAVVRVDGGSTEDFYVSGGESLGEGSYEVGVGLGTVVSTS